MGGGFGLINTGEDCLHLSVHVPLHQDGDGPLAVMVWTTIIIKIIDNICSTIDISITSQVWLTGGAFIMGGGSWFGPDYWMIHNIILVKICYWILDDSQHHTGHNGLIL